MSKCKHTRNEVPRRFGHNPKLLIILFCLLISINIVLGEVALGDIQKVVREENKKTIDEFSAKLETTKKDIQASTIDFANQVMKDISKMITDTEKKIILISSLSIIGILLLIEGILGFIRIRREQNVLLIMKKDIEYLKASYDAMHTRNEIPRRFGYNPNIVNVQKEEQIKVNKEEEEKLKKINELKEQLQALEQKEVELVPPTYVEPVKKGFFGKKKVK